MNITSEKKIIDMTHGSPYKLLLGMAFPLMIGNAFQQLYAVADAAIVGRGIGVSAFAAIGASSWFGFLFQSVVQGMADGFSIPIAQRFGAKDKDAVHKCIGNSALLVLILGICIATLALVTVRPVMTIMNTPQSIYEMSVSYLSITACGLPVIMAYNMLAGILRALGNSKDPLYAMIVSAAVNIILDIILVIYLGYGVEAAATATVIAQACSCIYCLVAIRKTGYVKLKTQDFVLDKYLCRRLISIGLPMSVQNAAIAIGGMVIQGIVNPLGVTFIAGYTAAIKLMGIIEMAGYAYGYSITTFNGQNMGAGNILRIKSGTRAGLTIGLTTSVIIACIMIFFGKYILMAFIDPTASDANSVLDIGYEFLFLMSLFFPPLYIIHILRPAIQGLGNTYIPLMSCLAELVMRIASALILPGIIGYSGFFWAEILAWLGADMLLIPGFIKVYRKICNTAQN